MIATEKIIVIHSSGWGGGRQCHTGATWGSTTASQEVEGVRRKCGQKPHILVSEGKASQDKASQLRIG